MPGREEQPRWSAVVVNYRSYDLVRTCVKALRRSTAPPAEILVVDNQSDETAATALLSEDPDLHLIANAHNIGYAAACNLGWRSATQPLVLFVNPDVTVDRDCVSKCIEVIEGSDEIAMATCRLVLPNGQLDHACHRGLPTASASFAYALRLNRFFPKSRRLARYTMSWMDLTTTHDVEACSGAFMLVRRSVLERLQGWDDKYWFYGEDLDLCVRIGRLGRRIAYVGMARATHLKGASSHLRDRTSSLTRSQRMTKRRVQRAIIESHERFFEMHIEPETQWLTRMLIRTAFSAQRVRLRFAMTIEDFLGG